MSDASVFFDAGAGAYTAPVQHGPVVRWQDPLTRSVLFTVTWHQRVEYWAPSIIGARARGSRVSQGRQIGFNSSFLVEESAPRDTGVAGIVEWTQTYAVPPRTWTDAEAFVYNLQIIVGNSLSEIPMLLNSTIVYEYWHTEDPTTIPLLTAYLIGQVGPDFYATTPRPLAGAIVAENSTLEKWKGNFWARKTRWIPFPVLTIYAP